MKRDLVYCRPTSRYRRNRMGRNEAYAQLQRQITRREPAVAIAYVRLDPGP